MDRHKATAEFSAKDLEAGPPVTRTLYGSITALSKIFVDDAPMDPADPLAEEVQKQTGHYSVTPETLRSKKFLSKEAMKLKGVLEQELTATGENLTGLSSRAAEFKKEGQNAINKLKQLSDGVVESGEFTKPEKEISDFNERFLSKTAILESYAQELHKYLSFVERNKDLFFIFCGRIQYNLKRSGTFRD